MTVRSSLPFAIAASLALAVAACKPPAARQGASMPPVQVIAVDVTRQPVHESLSLVGTLAPNEMIEVKSEIEGVVDAIGFKEGQPVKKGDLLVKLDETKLAASLSEAEANYKLSKTTYARNEELLRGKLISQQENDQAAAIFHQNAATVELRKRLLKDARIYSPFDGIATARLVSPGQVINRNTPLTSIVDLDPVKVEMHVPERFLSRLKQGQSIEIRVATYPGKSFKGTVFFIAPFVDQVMRTALVKAEIPNPDHDLKPGMFANLDLTISLREQALVIPEAAIAQTLDEDRAMVFVVDPSSIAQIRPVKLGVRMPGRVEILSGLEASDKVIVEGVQKVGPGSKVVLAPAQDAAPYLPKAKPSPRG